MIKVGWSGTSRPSIQGVVSEKVVWLVMGDDVNEVFMIRVGRNCAEGVVTVLRRGTKTY